MKKVLFTLMCLVAMLAASMSLKAQEVTITLDPGYTWISYLGTEPQDFATVLGSFTPEVGDVIMSQWGNATYRGNGQWRGNISQFSPGYGYMYKSVRTESVQLTMGLPLLQLSVTTAEPTDITTSSMTCGGTVTDQGNSQIIVRGVCWSNTMSPTIADPHTTDGYGTGTFSSLVEGLQMNSTYYVRAYAITSEGIGYGNEIEFTTQSETLNTPFVITLEVTDIIMDAAVGNAVVIDEGDSEVIARGICWSTNPRPTIADNHNNGGVGLGTYTVEMSGLTPGTVYYARAYAMNSTGISYGQERVFTTYNPSIVGDWICNEYDENGEPTTIIISLHEDGSADCSNYANASGQFTIIGDGAVTVRFAWAYGDTNYSVVWEGHVDNMVYPMNISGEHYFSFANWNGSFVGESVPFIMVRNTIISK